MKPKLPLLFAAGQALVINAEALPEWIQLAPFGNHPTRDKKRVQVFNSDAAKQVIQWFNFFPRRLGRLMGLNATPVWIGHPDFDPDTWPERTQLGNVADLEERADGLYGKIAWNAEAPTALRDAGHKFPSVAWDCDEGEGDQLHPAMLWSVGMWRTPNIKSVQPVINAAEAAYEETEEDKTEEDKTEDTETETETPPEDPDMKLKERLIEAGLITADANDDAVMDALNELIALREQKPSMDEEKEAVTTEVNAANTRITELEGQLTQLNAARVEDELTRLIETGRCSKVDEDTVRTELNADFATARAKYSERKIQLNSAPLDLGKHKPAIMAANERLTVLQSKINERMTQTNCSYDEAWRWSQTDEATRALHDSMKAEDEARQA
jgi:hypothetical protein